MLEERQCGLGYISACLLLLSFQISSLKAKAKFLLSRKVSVPFTIKITFFISSPSDGNVSSHFNFDFPFFASSKRQIIKMSASQQYPHSTLSSSSPQEYDVESTWTQANYAREMFNHTKKQMDAATRSAARRRSPNAAGTNVHRTLNGDETSISSVDSRESQ